jgi:hypothetical protein
VGAFALGAVPLRPLLRSSPHLLQSWSSAFGFGLSRHQRICLATAMERAGLTERETGPNTLNSAGCNREFVAERVYSIDEKPFF